VFDAIPSPPLTSTAPQQYRLLATLMWWFMVLSCIAVVVFATRFFLATPDNEHFARYILPLRLHIAGGMGALLAGPWQFSERLTARALNLHPAAAKFYGRLWDLQARGWRLGLVRAWRQAICYGCCPTRQLPERL
jgi:hypothetical protein